MIQFVSRTFVIVAFAMVTAMTTGAAQANPFSKLSGSWRGSGQVSPLGGQGERVRCRVGYSVSGASVTQSINCAGTDYRVNASGKLTYANGKVTGSWTESNYNVGGKVYGTAKPGQMYLRITGDAFSGRMAIKAAGGSRHTVHITQFDAGSGKYTTLANMSLSR